MEKDIERLYVMPQGEKQAVANDYSPLVLAYIGDCVFDLLIKQKVIAKGNQSVQKLHECTSRYVNAAAQSRMMRVLQPLLTETEHSIYRRGRNSKSVSPAKNQSITDYRRATGFEALIGFLYVDRQFERLYDLIETGLKAMEDIYGSE